MLVFVVDAALESTLGVVHWMKLVPLDLRMDCEDTVFVLSAVSLGLADGGRGV